MKQYDKNNGNECFQDIEALAARPLRNQSGIALVTVMLLSLVILTLVPVAMRLTTSDMNRTEDFQQEREAFYIADAGLEMAKAVVQNMSSKDVFDGRDLDLTATTDNGSFTDSGALDGAGNFNEIQIPGGADVAGIVSSLDGNTYTFTQVSYNGGNYKVRLFDNDDANMCPNDGSSPPVSLCTAGNAADALNSNFETWNDRDGLVYIEAIGETSRGTTKRLVASVKRKLFPPTSMGGAVILVGPKAKIEADSGTYQILGSQQTGPDAGSGFGINGSGADGECPGTNAMAVESTTTPGSQNYTDLAPATPLTSCNDEVCVKFSVAAGNGVEGTGGSSDDIDTNNKKFTGDDAEELWDDIITNGSPDINAAGGGTWTETDFPAVGWGTKEDPIVAYFNATGGATHMSGNIVGYGILVIDGDLDVSGTFIWNGLVLIGACPTCSGDLTGSGTLGIYGSTIIGNTSTDYSKSLFNGNAEFAYSCEGIAVANGAFNDTFAVTTWYEVE